jgi:serine phosphatase RsbU (regulator of sigma subunit)
MVRLFGLRTLAGQLSLWTALTVCAVLIVLLLVTTSMSRRQILRQTNTEALAEVDSHATEIDGFLGQMGSVVKTMAALQVLRGPEPPPHVLEELRLLMDSFPADRVFGLYYAFAGTDYRDPMAMPWIDRNSYPGPVVNKNDFALDTPDTVWFWGPKKAGGLSFTEPYFDDGGSEVTMFSANAPIFGPGGAFYGVSGVDITLDAIEHMVAKADLDIGQQHGVQEDFAYLVSAKGAIIVHPDRALMIGDGRPGAHVSTLPAGAEIMAADHGFADYRDGSEERMVYWSSVPLTGWKLVLDVPYSLVLAPVRALLWRNGSVAFLGVLLLIYVVSIIARQVAAPVNELTRAAAELESGQRASERLTPLLDRPDEVGNLGRAFTRMAEEIRQREESLASWNANLEKTVSERTAELKSAVTQLERLRAQEQEAFTALQDSQEKLAGELSEAAAYVQSVLPPPLSDGPVRTAWAFEPSSALGGDAFDYGPLPGRADFEICLLDVCGHGVGAALLSISVLNVLRAESLPGVDFHDPGAILAGLNTAFPMERNREMFFTAWCGIYQPDTRLMRFAGGGHPPAVLLLADGSTQLLSAPGPVIGALPGMRFKTEQSVIPAGARLFVFSDGACEIERTDGTMLTHADFRQLLARAPREGAVAWIMAELRAINRKKVFDDDVSLVEFFFP